jgi:hypothetical protein
MEQVALAISVIEFAAKEEPAVMAALQKLFSKPSPTPADYAEARAAMLAQSFAKLAPHAAANLPAGS